MVNLLIEPISNQGPDHRPDKTDRQDEKHDDENLRRSPEEVGIGILHDAQ